MKNNLKQLWWRAMVSREDIEGLDASILMHSKVWEASGHVAGFTDPLVDCKKCKQRFRADTVTGTKCLECGGELTAPRMFNLMFKTFMGPVESEANVVYLRPETAQGIYVNFINVQTALRKKIPFGIAQIGKAFRNEITPGNFIFRTREFEQMEMQFFVKAGTDGEWMEKWKEQRMQWHQSIGIRPENLRFHQHEPHALAHYAKEAYDIEYQFPFGWQEMEGIHNRTDYDLSAHQKYSGKNLTYFDEAAKERFIPYIIETSAGCDRILLAVLVDAYEEDAKAERVVLRLHRQLAPIKIAFFPLVNDEKLLALARKIYDEFRTVYTCQFDTSGSIGRRYRRQDEVGTPFGVTADFDSLTDHKVTVRDRDTMQQDRVEINQLSEYFRGRL